MAINVDDVQMHKLEDVLLNASGKTPLHQRFRALFTLKGVGGVKAVEIISKGVLLV